MAFTRIALGDGSELCVANLHATNDRPDLATADVLRAAEAATAWAGDSPLLFGGDLNLRPAEDPAAFEALRERFGLDSSTHPRAIDHLLTRNLETVEAPSAWSPELRELTRDGLRLRLSDHAPVGARFKTSSP
jgi:endonuclease/exonuclease/phosphatase (EEP) superfamily protein YafD